MKNINPLYLLIGAGVLLLVGGGFGVTKLLEETPEEKAARKTQNDFLKGLREILSGGWYQANKAKLNLTPANMPNPQKVKQKAELIWDAIGIFSDNEAQISGVFSSMKSKLEAYAIAGQFFNMYNRDLFQYLAKNLNREEMVYLGSLIANKPDQ